MMRPQFKNPYERLAWVRFAAGALSALVRSGQTSEAIVARARDLADRMLQEMPVEPECEDEEISALQAEVERLGRLQSGTERARMAWRAKFWCERRRNGSQTVRERLERERDEAKHRLWVVGSERDRLRSKLKGLLRILDQQIRTVIDETEESQS